MASSNKKEWMLEKLNRLVKLCKATEPDKPDDLHLFQPNIIDAHEMYNKVAEKYGCSKGQFEKLYASNCG